MKPKVAKSEQSIGSKQENSALDPEKQKKIEELKHAADEWIKICQSNMRVFDHIYGSKWIEEMGEKIRQLGAEAPKTMRENYDFQKRTLELDQWKIEQLSKLAADLDKGYLKTVPLGYDIERELEKIINSK